MTELILQFDAGLTKGLPKKATARPTTEALLRAFEGITLFGVDTQWYLTPLTALQQGILKLLGFSEDIVYFRQYFRYSTQNRRNSTYLNYECFLA